MSSSRLSLSPDLRGRRTPPRKRKRKERKGRRRPTAPSNKVPEDPYYHLCADLASPFWQKLSFKTNRGPTGRIRMSVSVCMWTRALQRAALRATEAAVTSTALAQPAPRSLRSSRTPAAQQRAAQAPPQRSPCGKRFCGASGPLHRVKSDGRPARTLPRAAPATPLRPRDPPEPPPSGPARSRGCRPRGPARSPWADGRAPDPAAAPVARASPQG